MDYLSDQDLLAAYAFKDKDSLDFWKDLTNKSAVQPGYFVGVRDVTSSGTVEVGHANARAHSWNPACGGECNCVDLVVTLPATRQPNGTEVDDIAYWSRSFDQNWLQVPPDRDLEWAMMLSASTNPVQIANGWWTRQIICKYKNWSHNQMRAGRIEVSWHYAHA